MASLKRMSSLKNYSKCPREIKLSLKAFPLISSEFRDIYHSTSLINIEQFSSIRRNSGKTLQSVISTEKNKLLCLKLSFTNCDMESSYSSKGQHQKGQSLLWNFNKVNNGNNRSNATSTSTSKAGLFRLAFYAKYYETNKHPSWFFARAESFSSFFVNAKHFFSKSLLWQWFWINSVWGEVWEFWLFVKALLGLNFFNL